MAYIRSKGGWAILPMFLFILLATTLPVKAKETGASAPASEPAVSSEDKKAETPEGMIGKATYYARRYNGRRTTSGVRYNPAKLSAAHQNLPLGTKVKVLNLANGKEIIVKVIDRCRPRKAPFIDLSRAAAKALGFLGKGVARVKITPIADPA